jgi:hypothetical protein
MGSHASRTFRLSKNVYARLGALADARAMQSGEKVTRTRQLIAMCEDEEVRLLSDDKFPEDEYQRLYDARLKELEEKDNE